MSGVEHDRYSGTRLGYVPWLWQHGFVLYWLMAVEQHQPFSFARSSRGLNDSRERSPWIYRDYNISINHGDFPFTDSKL